MDDGVIELCPSAIDNDTGKCPECRPGEYIEEHDNKGNQICKKCEPGTFQPGTGVDKDCNNCVEGTGCISCPAGTYQNASGKSECIPCPAGEYQSESGKSQCESCPAGTYTKYKGSIRCIDCPPGSYQNASGQTNCLKKSNCWQMLSPGEFYPHKFMDFPSVFKNLGTKTENVIRF